MTKGPLKSALRVFKEYFGVLVGYWNFSSVGFGGTIGLTIICHKTHTGQVFNIFLSVGGCECIKEGRQMEETRNLKHTGAHSVRVFYMHIKGLC
jgi:hypothetical protein